MIQVRGCRRCGSLISLSHRKFLRISHETKRSAGCAARRWEDRFAILLARQSHAALPSGMRGWGSRGPLADFVHRYQFLGDDIKIICFCVLRLLHMSLQNIYGCGLNTNKIYDMINVFNRYIGYCVYVVTETDSAEVKRIIENLGVVEIDSMAYMPYNKNEESYAKVFGYRL